MENQIEELKNKIISLQQEIEQLKIHLGKYTNPSCQKSYYQRNKERIIARNTEYAKNKKK